MDHRWDDQVRGERARRREHELYDLPVIEEDADVLRRDRLARERSAQATQKSPWEIGRAHYDQRDLYTENSRVDDGGYGKGPSIHPERGSYAYERGVHREDSLERSVLDHWPERHGRAFYAREAWPWLHYGEAARDGEHLRSVPPQGDVPQGPAPSAGPRPRSGFLHRLNAWRRRLSETVASKGRAPHGAADPTDAVLRRNAYEALWHHRELDVSDIEVFVVCSTVTLTGTVPNRDAKRLAEAVVAKCHGVHKVQNRLRIRRSDLHTPFAMGLDPFD